MHIDLRELLVSWPYDPDDNVRLARGADGRKILQVRLPLGIEQYELEGRPDGQCPHGKESVFDHHLQRLKQAKADGKEAAFGLNHEECAELFNEGTLYYLRYLNLFQAKDWPRTVRDTARNLRLFDFVKRHADLEEDQVYLEKWRPYIVRMNAVAAAMIEVDNGAHARALEIVNGAIGKIEALPERDDEAFQFERRRSLLGLRELADKLEDSRPLSELELLERELRQAIDLQNFERAAELRDRVRALRRQVKPDA